MVKYSYLSEILMSALFSVIYAEKTKKEHPSNGQFCKTDSRTSRILPGVVVANLWFAHQLPRGKILESMSSSNF